MVTQYRGKQRIGRNVRNSQLSRVVNATVIDIVGPRMSVRLASNGAKLHGIRYVGGPVSAGKKVEIDYSSGQPIAMCQGEEYVPPNVNDRPVPEKKPSIPEEVILQSNVFTDLSDTPETYSGYPSYVVSVTSDIDGLEFVDPADLGRTEFIELDDTPAAYASQAGKILVVNPDEDAVEFSEPWKRTGWDRAYLENHVSTFSFDDGTMTFTLDTSGGTIDYYINNVLYSVAGPDTVQITDTEGQWYIYYVGETLTASQTQWGFDDTKAFVCSLYWDATNNTAILFAPEFHTWEWPDSMNEYLHEGYGTRWFAGLTTTISGDNLNVTAGEIYDEDQEIEIEDDDTPDSWFDQPLTPLSAPILYKDGASGAWRKIAASTTPVYLDTNVLQWNEWTGATWQLSDVSLNRYSAYFVFASSDLNYPVYIVMGQFDDATLAAIREDANPVHLDFTDLPSAEHKLLARVIVQRKVASPYYELIETADYRKADVDGGSITTDVTNFTELFDTPDLYTGSSGLAVIVNSTEDGLEFGTVSSVGDFVDLGDTPSSLEADKWMKVNAGGDAIEWTTFPGIAVVGGGLADPYWYYDGAVASSTSAVGLAWIAPSSGTISKVLLYARDTGTSGTTTVDIHKNGTTIFTSQGNRPALAYDDADQYVESATPDVTSIVAGDVLEIYVDGVATGAEDLTVLINMVDTTVNVSAQDPWWEFQGTLNSSTSPVGTAWICPREGSIEYVALYAIDTGTSSASSGIIVDIHKNGTTIFSTQGNRPELLWNDADNYVESAEPDITAVAEGDIFTVYIDECTVDASNLTVLMKVQSTYTPFGAGSSFLDLSDTPATYTADYLIGVNSAGNAVEYIDPDTVGTTEFLGLDDTPALYTGSSGKVLSVTSGEDGLEFVDQSGGVTDFIDLDDTPSVYTASSLVSVTSGGDALEFIDPATVGTTEFLGLDDTPSSFTDQAGKVPVVNDAEDALEFLAGGSPVYVSPGYLFATRFSDQTMSVGDPVEFDTVHNSNIAWDAVNYRFTLKANRKYSMMGSARFLHTGSAGHSELCFYDVTNTDYIDDAYAESGLGTQSQYLNVAGAWYLSSAPIVSAIVTPETDIEVELRLFSETNHDQLDDYAWLNVQEIGIVGGLNTPPDLFHEEEFLIPGRYWQDPNSLTDYYPVYRLKVDIGTLPNATNKSVAHGITNFHMYSLTVYGNANDGTNILPLPFIDANNVIYQVRLLITATNVVVSTGADRTAMTGYVILEYSKTTDTPIDEPSPAAEYSPPDVVRETEFLIPGKWWQDPNSLTDFYPVYRLKVDLGSLPNAGSSGVAHGLSNYHLDSVTVSGNADDGTNTLPLPFSNPTASYAITIYMNTTNVVVDTGTDRTSYTGYAILEYSKTTDTPVPDPTA